MFKPEKIPAIRELGMFNPSQEVLYSSKFLGGQFSSVDLHLAISTTSKGRKYAQK